MVDRIRYYDWSATPLGQHGDWPDELKFAVNLCLKSSVPTAIYWGPELRLIYNDAWSPIPADRHPWALGRAAREVWFDIWHIIHPQFDLVQRTRQGFSTLDEMLPMKRGDNIEVTYWNYSFTPILDRHGNVLGIFNQGHETTSKVDLEKSRDEVRQSRERFEGLVKASAKTVWQTPCDGRIAIDSPSWREFTGQTFEEFRGEGWLNAIHPDDRARTRAAWADAVNSRKKYYVEYRLKFRDGTYRWTAARAVPLFDGNGNVREWIGMNEDISERIAHQEHTKLILRELTHRTKNLMSVIASIARQTLPADDGSRAKVNAFLERLLGLATSQDLLVRGEWKGATIRDLVTSHIEPFAGSNPSTVTISGPEFRISAEAAQSLGLGLHELATNAAKYGALKKGSERALSVCWSIETPEAQEILVFEWDEMTTSSLDNEPSPGFGSRLLTRLISDAVGGESTYDLSHDRVTWRLCAPTKNLRKR